MKTLSLLLLALAALLAPSSGDQDDSPTVSSVVSILGDICMERVERSITAEIKAEVEDVRKELRLIQQRLAPAPPVAGGCPPLWAVRDRSCYLMVLAEASWMEAHQACPIFDPRARLASIHPSNKHHVGSLARGDRSFRIGLFRFSDSGWSWSDNTAVDYTNWSPGEPNNAGDGEACGELTKSGKWNDRACSDRFAFLCQINLD